MDYTRRDRIWTPPQQPGRGHVLAPGGAPFGPGFAAAPGQPRLIDFQPLTTIMVPDSLTIIPEACAVQPFSGWIDGAGFSEIHFRVEVLQADGASLYLESSPTIDADVDQWVSVTLLPWSAPMSTPGFAIVDAVSSTQATGLNNFSRYIRWRVVRTTSPGSGGVVCFRIKAIVGASFTQWAEKPRLV